MFGLLWPRGYYMISEWDKYNEWGWLQGYELTSASWLDEEDVRFSVRIAGHEFHGYYSFTTPDGYILMTPFGAWDLDPVDRAAVGSAVSAVHGYEGTGLRDGGGFIPGVWTGSIILCG